MDISEDTLLDKNYNVINFIISTGSYNNLYRTITSFVTNCTDAIIINKWYILDVNGTDDKKNIVNIYPSFEYVKLYDLNKPRLSAFEYIISHIRPEQKVIIMGDCQNFIVKKSYLSICDKILNDNPKIGLLFFNNINCNSIPINMKKCYLYDKYVPNYNEHTLFMNEKQLNKTLWPYLLNRAAIYRGQALLQTNLRFNNNFFEFHIVDKMDDNGYKIAALKKKVSTSILSFNDIMLYNPISGINIIYEKSTELQRKFDTLNIIYAKHDLKTRYHFKITNDIIKQFSDNDFFFSRTKISEILTHTSIWSTDPYYIMLTDLEEFELVDNFETKLAELIRNIIPKDVDLIKLSNVQTAQAYLIKQSGIKKFMAYYGSSGFRSEFNNCLDNCPGILVDTAILIMCNKKPLPTIIAFDDYNFYSQHDSHGGDIRYAGKLSVSELKEIADNDKSCIGFNTLGWLKHQVNNIDQLIEPFWSTEMTEGLYVKNEKFLMRTINNLTDKKNNVLNSNSSNLTFTITTCKRFNYFKHTMDTFLTRCLDVDLIDKWLCVDDNSSPEDRKKMQETYPFFDFIFKEESAKGHAKSLNLIWNNVKTDYILHFEDDWLCNSSFRIANYLAYIKSKDIGQLILKKIGLGGINPRCDIVDNQIVYIYTYNPTHIAKPRANRQYDSRRTQHNNNNNKNNVNSNDQTDDYWWWPGFTLNPSIINLKLIREKIGLFNECETQDLFEYDYSCRVDEAGINIHYIELYIDHIGEVSSYVLNDLKRYWDL